MLRCGGSLLSAAAASVIILSGCGQNAAPEGSGFLGTAVKAAEKRGEDTTGLLRAMELMLQTGRRKLTDDEIRELLKLAHNPKDKLPSRRSATEAFSMMALNGDKERAIEAVNQIIDKAEPDQMPAILRALDAAGDKRFDSYAQAMLSSPEEYVRTSAQVAMKARSLRK